MKLKAVHALATTSQQPLPSQRFKTLENMANNLQIMN
ncbi:hypothetical protein EYZ11_003892 [Aspergillus tanneri]|uniref:Uncharacterized protein n=1 Tax=Aspergillus tanneri TaxID=1220188 RepID=A0A4S3JM73_9EURO|nr:hypothetical protein EYZ11_003892 [Aspergillus tanneri]